MLGFERFTLSGLDFKFCLGFIIETKLGFKRSTFGAYFKVLYGVYCLKSCWVWEINPFRTWFNGALYWTLYCIIFSITVLSYTDTTKLNDCTFMYQEDKTRIGGVLCCGGEKVDTEMFYRGELKKFISEVRLPFDKLTGGVRVSAGDYFIGTHLSIRLHVKRHSYCTLLSCTDTSYITHDLKRHTFSRVLWCQIIF